MLKNPLIWNEFKIFHNKAKSFLFGGNTVLKIKYAAVPLLTKTVGDFAAITTNKALKGL